MSAVKYASITGSAIISWLLFTLCELFPGSTGTTCTSSPKELNLVPFVDISFTMISFPDFSIVKCFREILLLFAPTTMSPSRPIVRDCPSFRFFNFDWIFGDDKSSSTWSANRSFAFEATITPWSLGSLSPTLKLSAV